MGRPAARPRPVDPASPLSSGTVIAAHGRHYLVQSGGERLQCVTRGKRSDLAVGDIVHFRHTSLDQGVVESIQDRSTLLYRSDQYKSKLLAANVDRMFIVTATEPGFSDDLISRALVAGEAAGVESHLLLNKVDIAHALPPARERLRLYAGLGYPVHELSATGSPDAARELLLPLLQDKTSIVIGQSGMGKSSLVNLLVPDADIAVREISSALDTGKHTTTFTRLYHIDDTTAIIDSPGFQEFGLYHLSEGMLERAFPEFQAHRGNCRFYNCRHLNEPGCAVLAAVHAGGISPMRQRLYAQLLHESSQTLY